MLRRTSQPPDALSAQYSVGNVLYSMPLEMPLPTAVKNQKMLHFNGLRVIQVGS
jgi:hypothetical protein